jgi:tetratricopeptide (TPR) repeat protein
MGSRARRGRTVKALGTWLAKFWLRRQVSLAVLLGRRTRSIELMRDVLRLDPDDAESRSALGNLLVEAGDPVAAVEQFVLLVERWPENAEAWFNLGFIHESRDDLANAERCFRRALQLNAKIDRAWYGLGLTLIRGGRLDEAVDALKKNIELQPFSPYGYYQLGMTYHHLGRDEDARRVEQKLRNFEPKYAATLRRDIAQTPPAASHVGTRPIETATSKEVIATPV